MRPIILTLGLLLLYGGLLFAQPKKDQLFSAAGYVGLTLAQIDGDYYFGYNRAGGRFGVEGQLLLWPKTYLSVGFGYTQQGARPNRKETSRNGNAQQNLRLNTIEVPLLLHYRLGKKTATGRKDNYQLYRSSVLSVGLVYSRLASYRAEATGVIRNLERRENWLAVEDEFRRSDVYLMAGYEVKMGLRSSIWVQHSRSLLGLYRPEEFDTEGVISLFPYYLTLGVKYHVY